ncbi:MAG: hypothetical protein ACQETQ_02050 [Spirochaetota bacterium]
MSNDARANGAPGNGARGNGAHRLRLAPGCRLIDPMPYLSLLEERFGISAAQLREQYVFFVGGNKYLYSLCAEHRLPPGPEVAFSGIKFMRISMKVPKLTTEASILLGARASRNYVELEADQLRAYFARQEIRLDTAASSACTGPGYVLVRHEGVTLGSAYLNPRDRNREPEQSPEPGAKPDAGAQHGAELGDRPLLRSWFPKHWSQVITIR